MTEQRTHHADGLDGHIWGCDSDLAQPGKGVCVMTVAGNVTVTHALPAVSVFCIRFCAAHFIWFIDY